MKEKIEYLKSVKEYIQLIYNIKETPKWDIKTNTYEINGIKYKILNNRDIIGNRKG